jgi:hypothetical protein
MNLDKLKDFITDFGKNDLPTAAAALVGILLLFFMLKTTKFLMKLALLLVAVGLFAGAYWWHAHK